MQIFDDPWQTREEDFPHDAAQREQLRFLLNFAVLAPSICNTQPWIFRIAGDAMELYADRSRMLRETDPRGRQLVLSCGAALMHLRIAIAHYGFQPIVKTFPQMDVVDLLASIKMGPTREAGPTVHRLFKAIRQQGEAGPSQHGSSIKPSVLAPLGEAVTSEGVILDVMDSPEKRAALSAFIHEAERLQRIGFSTGNGLGDHSGDGVAIPAPQLGGINWGEARVAAGHSETQPLLAVISTRSDNPFEWLAAGQALARMMLVGREFDIQATFLNQPVEVEIVRSRLGRFLGTDRVPQLVLRLERGNRTGRTPRRPLHDVLSSF